MDYTISSENKRLEKIIQQEINECLDTFTSFYFDAGAGAGKTYALEKGIEHILKTKGDNLRQRNQIILCITYTNSAKNEILDRLGQNSRVLVSTIHEFLWSFIYLQQGLLTLEHKKKVEDELKILEEKNNGNPLYDNIDRSEFKSKILDEKFLALFYEHYSDRSGDFRNSIENYDGYFSKYLKNVKNFKSIVTYINKKEKLKITLQQIKENKGKKIIYNPKQNRDKLENYIISHDTLLLYCDNIIVNQPLLKRLFSDRYPYVLIDEYQDTDVKVINIIDSIREYSNNKKDFVIGFFGDSVQKIYSSGVGILPQIEKYRKIEKKFNRRSSEQIVELIEMIRNDNFGQKSIYDNFNTGSYKFYLASDDFELGTFLQDNDLKSDTACLLMKNNNISEALGFGELLSTLKKFPRFSGNNYDNVNNEFLQKNLQQMGWFLRDVLTYLDFIKKSENDNSTINEITQFVPHSKSAITFGGMKYFINSMRDAKFLKLTIGESLVRFVGLTGELSGKSILKNIFSIDADTEDILIQIKNRAYDYFYYFKDLEEEAEKDTTVINEFFDLDICQFINWYDYIFDEYKHRDINYYTLHGSKGLEFENVVVVLQDNFARKKDYCSYFFKNYSQIDSSDNRFYEVRNLLYVAFSRAIVNLYVIYKGDKSEDIIVNIKRIFGNTLSLID